jgi:hypothetical protein
VIFGSSQPSEAMKARTEGTIALRLMNTASGLFFAVPCQQGKLEFA